MPDPLMYRLQLRDEDDTLLGEVKLTPQEWADVRVNKQASDTSDHWSAGTTALRNLNADRAKRQQGR